jgi:hypothetical protein
LRNYYQMLYSRCSSSKYWCTSSKYCCTSSNYCYTSSFCYFISIFCHFHTKGFFLGIAIYVWQVTTVWLVTASDILVLLVTMPDLSPLVLGWNPDWHLFFWQNYQGIMVWVGVLVTKKRCNYHFSPLTTYQCGQDH